MNIVFLDASTIGTLPNLSKLEKFGKVTFFPSSSRSESIQRVKDAEVIITNKVIIDREVINEAPKLRLICVAATGMNNVDLDYAQKRDIPVKNAIGYSTKSVAQFTFSSLFYLLHQTRYYDDYMKSGAYCNSEIFTHIHHDFRELDKKTWGIIGLGSIGSDVAKIANAFGAEVIYYSTSGKNNNPHFKREELPGLLSKSDIISIHAPLNENTKGLIGFEEIRQMKKHAILINMGRGSIIKEHDLAGAIDQNLIGGAILDVFEEEPLAPKNPLLMVKNKQHLLLTPHIAWASYEARTRLIDIICDHLQAFKK